MLPPSVYFERREGSARIFFCTKPPREKERAVSFALGHFSSYERGPPMVTHEERLRNLYSFGRDVLGYDQLTELHLAWFDILLREKYVVLVTPPGHLKTTACTITYPLFRLTEDHNMRILLVNEILDNAKGFLREIKAHLTQNEKFKKRYGDWDLSAHTWTEDRIQIPRTEIRKEPSIAVASVLGTVVSIHPNLIVIDDPCSERNTFTLQQRQKVISWFRKNVLPRMDDENGQIIVITPRWHKEDLAGFIMSEPGYSHWKVISQPAEWTDDAGKQRILLPEKFTEERLKTIRAQMGARDYNMLYLNKPSSEAGADFKEAWIDSGRYDEFPKDLTVYAGIDLATGTGKNKAKNAYFAYCVIGVDKAGDAYIKDAYRDKIPFHDQLKVVKRINRLHHPRLIIVETNAYQSVFLESLRTDPETRLLPLKEKNTQGDKDSRIRGLAPLFENGFIRFPKNGGAWTDQMVEELMEFPDGTKDMLDALWLALQGVELQRIEPRIIFASDIPEPEPKRPRDQLGAAL